MQQRSTLRILFSVLLISLSVLGLVNVLGDNSEVVTKARSVACKAETCDARLAEMSRNPFFQTYRFEVGGKQSRSVQVQCHRQLYFVGEFQCAEQ